MRHVQICVYFNTIKRFYVRIELGSILNEMPIELKRTVNRTKLKLLSPLCLDHHIFDALQMVHVHDQKTFTTLLWDDLKQRILDEIVALNTTTIEPRHRFQYSNALGMIELHMITEPYFIAESNRIKEARQ